MMALLCCYSQTSLSKDFNYPGGVAQLRIAKHSNDLPMVRYGITEPAILDQGSYWRILLGIGLDQLPGEYVLYTRQNGKDEAAVFKKFEVFHKNYRLSTDQSSKLEALPDYEELSELDFNNTQPPTMPMQLPFTGEWDQEFGQLNISERDAKSDVQNYTYSNAISNTLVKAPQAGIIAKIAVNKDKTSTLIIDHGRGIYTLLHGVIDLAVNVGNGVVAGAVIAKVPDTRKAERVSDPRPRNLRSVNPRDIGSTVYWQVQLNGVFVNPLILTEL